MNVVNSRRIVVLLGLALCVVSGAQALLPGGGKDASKGADCFVGLEGYGPGDETPFGKKGKPAIQCTDCDPTCDLDGATEPNGSCTFSIAVRVNDASDPACTPAPLKKVTAKAKTKGTKLDFSTSFQAPLDGSSATSGFLNFPVLVKKFGTPKAKSGTGKVLLSAKKLDKPKLKDRDKFLFACNPRPEGEACPVSSTTTTTVSSTTTTLETTTSSTTVTSTTLILPTGALPIILTTTTTLILPTGALPIILTTTTTTPTTTTLILPTGALPIILTTTTFVPTTTLILPTGALPIILTP